MKRADIVIGASEAAAPLDLDEYQTPVEWYAKKLGLVDDDGDSEAAWLGRHLEHSIADAFAEKHDVTLARVPTLRSRDRPWLRATPDRVIMPGGMSESFRRRFDVGLDEVVGIEVKTTGLATYKPRFVLDDDWGAPLSDVVPQRYVVQTLVQSKVLNEHLAMARAGVSPGSPLWPLVDGVERELVVRRVFVVALLPGRGLVDYIVPAAREAVDHVVDALEDFVEQHLIPEVPPAPQSAADWRIVGDAARRKARGDKQVRKIDDPDDPVAVLVAAHLRATEQLDAAETEKARLRARLIEVIGDGYALDTPAGKALLTIPSEVSTPRLAAKAFADEVIEKLNEAAIVAPSPFVDELLKLAEKHTKSHTTGRTLRVTARK